MWCLAWFQKIDTVICSQGPVVVLAGTVHSCKWFLVKKTSHTVSAGYFLKDAHHDLVMVCRNIYRCIDWCQLMLCRCYFIMLCFGCYPKLPAFFVYFFHVCGDSLADSSQVMIIHLLALRRHCSEKRSSCVCQILTLKPFFFVDQKIFLLCSNRWCNFL